jgi:peptide chain release factor 2
MTTSNQDKEMLHTLVKDCTKAALLLLDDCKKFELELLLNGEFDDRPARIILTAGAGGTEACDWVDMLLRMYIRHAEKMGYIVKIEDKTPGDVVGYKSAEIIVEGSNAFGWFRGEKGAHRLVRLSPFNANNKRQTTFGGVDVVPILEDEEVNNIDIPETELEITTMRSGGKGGQNVSKYWDSIK